MDSVCLVCLYGCQRKERLGALAAAKGIDRLDKYPNNAKSTTQNAARYFALSAEAIIPAPRVPIRMAIKVPASTRALPGTNSFAFNFWGKRAYLTGPKNADCVPIKNSSSKSTP